jgi:hypothetical protein
MRAWSGSKKWSGRSLSWNVLGEPVVDHQRAEQCRLGLDILGERGRFVRLRVGKSDDVGHGGHPTPDGG